MTRPSHLVSAVEYALRAPSVHNTQSWRWRIANNAIELYSDGNRQPGRHRPRPARLGPQMRRGPAPRAGRVGRSGHPVQVERMPEPENSGYLATVSIRPGADHPGDATLFRSISRRRTDRRRMSRRPVPAEHLRELAEHVERTGTRLIPVHGDDMRARLANALTTGAHRQEFSPGYAAELELWTRRYPPARDGIPAPTSHRSRPAAHRPPHYGDSRTGSSGNPAGFRARGPTMTRPSCSSSPSPAMTCSTGSRPARPRARCCWPRPGSGWLPRHSARASRSTRPGTPFNVTSCTYPNTRSC
jgi:hypothetical protein